MKRLLKTAVVMGVTYLLNNKQARRKVMNVVQAFVNKNKQPTQR